MMRTFDGLTSLKHHRDRLRRSLEIKSGVVAVVSALAGFAFVQYSITGFAYAELAGMFIAWSVLIGSLVAIFLGPLTFMLLVFGWVDRRVHQFVAKSRIEIPRWPAMSDLH